MPPKPHATYVRIQKPQKTALTKPNQRESQELETEEKKLKDSGDQLELSWALGGSGQILAGPGRADIHLGLPHSRRSQNFLQTGCHQCHQCHCCYLLLVSKKNYKSSSAAHFGISKT